MRPALLSSSAPLLFSAKKQWPSATTALQGRRPQQQEVLGNTALQAQLMALQAQNKELQARNGELLVQLAEITKLALTDALTMLPNRLAFDRAMETISQERSEKLSQDPYGLLLLDLNGFKAINDTLGHPVGDEALRFVAASLRESTSGTGYSAYRIGGDEFAILIPHAKSVDEMRKFAESLYSASQKKVFVYGPEKESKRHITFGIGGILVDLVRSPKNVVQYADTLLYESKPVGTPQVANLSDRIPPSTTVEFSKGFTILASAASETRVNFSGRNRPLSLLA
jgi:diguanylate cyclase (GGDEF)-like protein